MGFQIAGKEIEDVLEKRGKKFGKLEKIGKIGKIVQKKSDLEMKHKLGHWKTEILHNLETILTKYDANLLVRKFANRLKPQLIISLVDER